MKKILKMACLCLGLGLGSQVMAQTLTTGTPLQRLVSGTLQTASTTVNAFDVVAFPWASVQVSTPSTSATLPVSFSINLGSIPASATNFVWSVQGDLIITAGQNTSTITVGNINKLIRGGTGVLDDRGQSKGRLSCSYSFTPSGTGGPCSGAVSTGSFRIDLLKQFSYITSPNTVFQTVPEIVGPLCISPNTLYTYSVDETMQDNPDDEIGFDSYTWDISALTGAVVQYQSSDKSSVTFLTGTTVPASSVIRCFTGQVNSPTAQANTALRAFASKELRSAVAAPAVTMNSVALSTTTSNCLAMNVGGNVVFSVTPVAGITYDWEFGQFGSQNGSPNNGWNTNPAQTGALPYKLTNVNSITISNVNNQPGTIILTAKGGCGGDQKFIYTINRTAPTQASNLVTLLNCTPQGTGLTAAFAAGAGTVNLNSFNWTAVTAGGNWVFSGGQTILTPGAIPPATPQTAPGAYTVNLSLGGTCTPAAYVIRVRPSAVTLTSPTAICAPVPTTPTVALTFAPASSTLYSYVVTGSLNSVSPASNSSTALTRLTGAQTGTITATYTVAAGCATSSLPLNIAGATQPSTPTTPLDCIGSGLPGITARVTVANYPNTGTYTITAAGGGASTILATNPSVGLTAAAGGIIDVPISGTAISQATTGNYTITHNVAGCPASASTAMTLIRNDGFNGTALDMSVFDFGTSAGFNMNKASVITPGTFSTPWGHPITASVGWYFVRGCVRGTPTSVTENILLTVGGTNPQASPWNLGTATPGTIQYGVHGSHTIGSTTCQYRICKPITGYTQSKPGKGNDQVRLKVQLPVTMGKIFPNPNRGSFEIEILEDDENAHAAILDMQGREVANKTIQKGLNTITEKSLPTGTYQVMVWLKGKMYSDQIIVTQK